MEEDKKMVINKVVNDNADSLTIGTPTVGSIKVYGDFMKSDEFTTRIDNAIKLRKYAQDKIKGGD